jgi:glutathione synthase/RimK-type ligase-like ATP-grasp enzyme
MLLIITNQEDIHPNPVIDHLTQLKVPFFRLNTENLYSHYNVYYQISNDVNDFCIQTKDGFHTITREQISAVWERRPCKPMTTYDPIDNEQLENLLKEEGDGFLKYLRIALHQLPWIGHAVNEYKAGSKLLQKIVAKQVGFSIPQTIFSNQVTDVEKFKTEKIAVKPIRAFGFEISDEENLIFYTSLTNKEKLLELGEKNFRNNINFLESYIEKKFEVRTTIIGKSDFSAIIESQTFDADKGKIDWRQGYDHGMTFRAYEIPQSVIDKCHKFLAYFDLEFGCFDFIVDQDDVYHFLECNTNGQWMWIEDETNLPISLSIAQYFKAHYESKTQKTS